MGQVERLPDNSDTNTLKLSENYHHTAIPHSLRADLPPADYPIPDHVSGISCVVELMSSRREAARRDERGIFMLGAAGLAIKTAATLPLPGLFLASGLVAGTVYELGKVADVHVALHNHTELNVTKADETIKAIRIGGADFCPVSADVRAQVNSNFWQQQSADLSVHGIGGTLKGPKQIWGVDSDMLLTGPACMDKQTGMEVTKVTDIPKLDAQGNPTGKKTKAVYAVMKDNVPITFHISEKDPLADTFKANDNEFAKLLNLGGDQLALFPYTDFLHPTINMDIHTLLHQTDLTIGANKFASLCGPQIMAAAEDYLEDQVEDEMFDEFKDFNVERKDVHADMSKLSNADYLEPYAASETKLKANDKLNYETVMGSCEMSKDLTIEVVK